MAERRVSEAMPEHLATFDAARWSRPGDTRGLGECNPEQRRQWSLVHAHWRWTEARLAFAKEHDLPTLKVMEAHANYKRAALSIIGEEATR
jgi:hypothetical protein